MIKFALGVSAATCLFGQRSPAELVQSGYEIRSIRMRMIYDHGYTYTMVTVISVTIPSMAMPISRGQ